MQRQKVGERSDNLTLRFNEQAYGAEEDKGRAQRRWEDRLAYQVKTLQRILERKSWQGLTFRLILMNHLTSVGARFEIPFKCTDGTW